MVRLFFKPSKKTTNLINTAIKKAGSIKQLGKEIKICRITISNWLKGNTWIEHSKLKAICDYMRVDVNKIIDGELVRSTQSQPEIYNSEWFKINPNVALLLGWICTEGYVPKKSSRVTIGQKDKNALIAIKEIFNKEYPTKNKVKIRDEHCKGKGHCLEIGSPMFWYALTQYFNIPTGKKNFIVKVPEQVFDANEDCKKAFLAGSIEGDGSWPPSTLTIRMTSQAYIEGCGRLFRDIRFRALTAPLKQENTWMLQVCGKYETINIIYALMPFLLHEEKFSKFINKTAIRKTFFDELYVDFESSIITKTREILNCSHNELAKILSKRTGRPISGSTVHYLENKGYGRPITRIRLPLLIEISKILNDDSLITKEYKWIIDANKGKTLLEIKDGHTNSQNTAAIS